MQSYLKSHCDCHPLVTGVLGGIINDYMPARGNFDAWAADPVSGGQLNLADLDLVQKRNHILKAALGAVPVKGRQILSVLALLSEAVDWATLSALNPDLRPDTVRDLERRGLLQYDGQTKRYDLHPVVRGIAAGGLPPEERDAYGQRVVDYFSALPHRPYSEAETLDDVRDGLSIVRTLLSMGHYQQACDAYRGELANALLFNLEAYAETVALLRPFFPKGWAALPEAVDEESGSFLAMAAARVLLDAGDLPESLAAYGSGLAGLLRRADWPAVSTAVSNISATLHAQNRLALEDRCVVANLSLASLSGQQSAIFRARQDRFRLLIELGQWADANAMWDLLDRMGRNWARSEYRPGDAESVYAQFRFWQGDLRDQHLAQAELLSTTGRNRGALRFLRALRGEWHLNRGEWALAAESLRESVSMARAVGRTDATAETQLALAQFHRGELDDPRREAEQLANVKRPSHRALADLWLAIGDRDQAAKHALAAYLWAWADGEPYVHRYELNQARRLLETLSLETPSLPPFDPAKEERLPWEDGMAAAIEKLRAEKQVPHRKEN
jgi:hypothetical protein